MSNASNIKFCLLTLVVAGCATPQPIAVPEKLRPGPNESLAMIVPAKGVQIYECRARKDQAGAYEWAFVAPEADLFDVRGSRIGRHYGGPHWESNDGSKVLGAVKRVNTVGGVAPAGGCSQSAAGTTARVAYTADYYFFTAR